MSKLYASFEMDFDFLDNLEVNVKREVNEEIRIFASNTVADAQVNVNAIAADESPLKQLIKYEYINGVAIITSNAGYSAYVEFGTGIFAAGYVASLPPDLQAYAMQFFVNGKGRLPARPFLFPAYFKNLAILKDNIKNILNEG